MKKLLTFIFLFLLSHASAQSQPSIVFSRYFDFEPNIAEGAFRVINLPNGYAFTSIRWCTDGSVCVDLAQVDFYGNLIFHDTILGTSFINGAIYDPTDNTIMLCGETAAANGFFEIVLIKRNLHGETIWRKQYKNDSFSFNVERDIVKLPDEGFMILGNRREADSLSTTVFLMRTDAEGNMLWAKDYEYDYKQNWARSLILVSDSTVAFVAHNRHYTPKFTSGLVKTDLDGNIIWSSHVENDESNDAVMGAMLKNGDFVMSTRIDTICAGCIGNDPAVVCLNPEGQVKWQRYFLYRILDFTNIVGTSDGGVLVCGAGLAQDIGPQGTSASFLIKLSADGEVLWERVINTDDQVIMPVANTAIETADGGILVGATNARYHNGGATIEADALLLKLGPDGCYVPDCDDTLMIITTPTWEPPAQPDGKEKSQIKVYPNPADAILNIAVGSAALGGSLRLLDLQGRLVGSLTVNAVSLTIPTNQLLEGIYWIQCLNSDGRTLGTAKVYIQH